MVRYSKEIKKVQDEAFDVLEQGLKTRAPELIDGYQLLLRQAETIQDAVNDMNKKSRTLRNPNKKK